MDNISEPNSRLSYEELLEQNTQLKNQVQEIQKISKKVEGKYQNIIESSPLGVNLYTLEEGDKLIFKGYNKTAETILGVELESLIGKTIEEAFPPLAQTVIPFEYKKTAKTGKEFFSNQVDYDFDKIIGAFEVRAYQVSQNNIAVNFADITDRLKKEEELRVSQERFDLAMDASRDGLFDWDLIKNEIYYSPGWKKMLGYNEQELPNDFSIWEKLTKPEDVERSWKMQQELINKQRDRFEMEFKMKHKNGNWIDVLSRAEAVFNNEGKAIRIVGTHIDISERKKVEKQLIQSEENLKNTFNLSPSIITKANLNTGFYIEVNQAVTRILGYSIEEFTSKPYTDLVHPDDVKKTTRNISEQTKGNKIFTFENRFLCKDGSYKWLSWNATDADSEGIALGVASDITERKKAELELKTKNEELQKAKENAEENEERLDFVLQGSNLAYWDWNIETNVVKRNRRWAEILGYTLEEIELTVNQWTDFIYPDDKDKAWSSIKDHLEDNTSFHQLEYRMLTKKGQLKWILDSAKIVSRDKKGKPIRMSGTHLDITERKQQEKELVIAKEKAEEVSGKLTAALESMSDAVFISDIEGNFVNFNDAFATFHKFKNKAECTKTLNEYPAFLDVFYLDGKFLPLERWVVNRALRGDTGINEEYTLKRKDTGETWIGSYTFGPIRNTNGDIIGSVVTARDITAQKNHEKELLLANEKVSSSLQQIKIIQANTPNITWKWDIDKEEKFKNCYISEGVDEFLALPKGSIGNSIPKFFSYILPEYLPLVDDAIKNAINNPNKLISIEYEVKKADGKLAWLSSSGKVIPENGKLAIYGSTIDITEKKQNEQKLVLSDTVFNLTLDMFCIAGFDGYFKYLNPAWEKTLGWSIEELLSKPWLDFVHPDDAKNTENIKSVIVDGKEIYKFENRYICKDGSTKWFSWNSQPFPQENIMIGAARDITEAKKIENELLQAKEKAQESEKKLLVAQELSHVGSWEYIIDTDTVKWSIELYNIFERSYDLPAPKFSEQQAFYTEESFAVLEKAVEDCVQRGIPYEIELDIYTSSGSIKHIISKGEIKKDNNNKVIGSYGTAQDITVQKKTELEIIKAKEKAVESEKNLQITLQTAMDGYWVVDIKGCFLNVNDTYCRMSGYDREELLSMCISDVDVVQSPDKIIQNIQRIKQLGQLRFETKHRHKDGSIYDVEMGVQYQERNDGQFVCFIKDITERKTSETKLLLNEQRLNALVELNQMTDKSDEYIHDFTLNEAIKLTQSKIGFLGFVNEDESEVNIYKWSDAVMKECTVKNFNFNFVVAEAGVWGDVIRQRKPLILNDYSQPISNKKGLPVGHVNIKNYLSIPTFSENKIKAIIAVANKEADYSQADINQVTLLLDGMRRFLDQRKEKEELINAKQKAEESDRLKSAFLANMSHEIRTPMNGILGFTELLQDASLSVENQKNYIKIIKKSGDRLLSTVNDIIEISKIESGDINITKSEVDFIKHLDTQVSFFKPEAEKKNIEIVVENNIDGNDLKIATDKTKLSSILSNLIKNAIKYTNAGTINVGFKIGNNQIFFSCQDTGIGIPKNRLEAIFNRFEQADIEDRHAHQGSGLGLAIVKSYVEMLEGKVWVESEKGKGSIFYVSLPYELRKKKEQIIPQVLKSSDSRIKNINVLIAEDDEISSMHLLAVLNGKVKNIKTVQNGIEAVVMCEKDSSIDLILMDMKMPEMDGIEATKTIRKFNKDVLIIAQTAYALEGDNKKALDAGCNDYISKPIDKNKLFELINKYFEPKP